jgi:hypothetical protein
MMMRSIAFFQKKYVPIIGIFSLLCLNINAQTWSAQEAYFGWYGDSPRTTPNATVITTSIATASVMSGGTGVAFTSTQDGVATVFKADNINSTSMATAVANGDYIKATLYIPLGNKKIRFTYASLVGTIGTWQGAYTYGMTVTDIATGVSTTVFQDVAVPTTQTNVPQTLATPYEMLPGKDYEVRWYMYGASFSSNVTRALDNPVLYFQTLTCYAAATPPALSATSKSNVCPGTTIDLSTITVSNTPANTVFEWHSGTPATAGNKLTDVSTVVAGTYYGVFYDATYNCYSNTTAVTALSNTCTPVPSLCTSQAVFYSQNFGAGAGIGAALPVSQIPSYTYNSNNYTVDGQYTIIQNPRNGLIINGGGPWLNGTDHTGDVNGRMLLVNGSSPGQIAYNQPVTGLVIGRTYAVRTFIANIIDATKGNFPLLPNINFYIKDASNNVLATTSTGDIPISATLTWLQKEMSFVATTTSVTFQLVSNTVSGNGNDFVLDDITFYEKVEPLLSSVTATVSCPSYTTDLNAITVSNLPSGIGASLSWHSGTPATAANKLTNIAALPAGTYYAAFTDGTCYSNATPFTVTTVPCVPVANLCTSQAIFYSQNFGAGAGIGPALPVSQIPSYTYNSNNSTVDGQYTLIQNPRNGLLFGSNSPWLTGSDHTGNANGRMLLVNGSNPGQIAYNQPVTGLVIGRTYVVRTFIANVIDATTGSYPLLPNINFYIKDAANTTLATTSTGDIPISATLTWLQKEMSFVATTTTVTFQLVSNNTSGNGNDFALDDITFYEKVEPILSINNTIPICPATTANLSSVTVNNLPVGASLSWHSGTPATTPNKLSNITALSAGTYYAAFTDGTCYSNTTPFVVQPNNCVVESKTNVCPDKTVNLSSIGTTNLPSGALIEWHTGTPATVANKINDITALGAGTYYFVFYDPIAKCYSNTTPFLVNIVSCPCPTLGVSASSAAPVTCSGGSITLTAAATGLYPLCQIQWQNSTNGVSWSSISGANASTYVVVALTASMRYRAIVVCPQDNCCN